jgi:hypothetical protein
MAVFMMNLGGTHEEGITGLQESGDPPPPTSNFHACFDASPDVSSAAEEAGMRRTIVGLAALAVVLVAVEGLRAQQAGRGAAPPAAQTPPAARGPAPPPTPVFTLADHFLQWRLLPSEKAYEAIDGNHLLQHVSDLAAVSRRYRDAGHPQFWGRIIGSTADQENAQWLMTKMTQIGLTDVHMEPLDLAPQWFPQSWDLTATGAGRTLKLATAQPAYTTPGTSDAGLDLEVVYAGLGSEADLIGRDLRGKAVLIFSNPMPGSWRHTSTQEASVDEQGVRTNWLQLAEKKGAAAIICSIQLPGNIRTQLYPTNTRVPTFSMGMKDGIDLREMIAKAPAGQPVRLKLKMEVKQVPGLKSGTVWGTLKGTTDEKIYVEAHRDGWFEAATDNGSGVATMLGVAEYFAKVPAAQRRRTIVFLGTSGHHNSGINSAAWLAEHHDEVFRNTALLINAEHTAAAQPELLGEAIRLVNNEAGFLWYGGGNQRPKLQQAAVNAFLQFGVPIYAEPENGVPGGEASRLYQYVPAVQASNYNMYFHSDFETPATVPAPGLAATTRAYVKIIEEVNKLEMKDLVLPQPAAATRGN